MRRRMTTLVASTLLVAGCAATRPPGPPEGVERTLPWGAVQISPDETPSAENLEGHLTAGFEVTRSGDPSRDADGPPAYRMLALSGGGYRGAFGAGFMAGWSSSGTRPRFDVITGISTGALMSTFVFLGSEYDDELKVYAKVTSDRIYRKRSILAGLSEAGVHDTTPLRTLLEEMLDEDVIDAVARRHQEGGRLFVGTTNLETGRFTVWDMGAIASSDREDRIQRYRDVILAAASFPVMFPPVYISVTVDGEQYWEAHVDGAARAALFGRTFMLDVEDMLEVAGSGREQLQAELYVVVNAQPPSSAYRKVDPKAASVARSTVNAMLDAILIYSADNLHNLAMFNNTSLYMTFIPSTVTLSENPLEFEVEEMSELYAFGYELGASDRRFILQADPPADAAELLEIVNSDEAMTVDHSQAEKEAGFR